MVSPWILRRPKPEIVQRMAARHHLTDVVASMLVSRGHEDPEDAATHLAASPMGLHDPMLLPGMEAACERLEKALADGENILIHGDYDVDGVTGTSLLVRIFRLLGAKVRWHIPNRFTDGYSFGAHSVQRAKDTGSTVVISVDNGTSAFETITELKAIGVDTIVTDHHEPPDGPLPPAVAIVNPKLKDSTYPWRELCGGAVAFKLAWGFAKRMSGGRNTSPELKQFLEDATAYVAIATVCDVVPLVNENRIFARFGLKALESSQNPGLAALRDVCGLGGRSLSAEDVGFQIGPRINASGRLGSAQQAVELLLAETPERGRELAKQLDALNIKRKEIEREVLESAREQALQFEDIDENPVLVLAGQNWHQGVVGIVAARLTEQYDRPTIIIGLDGAEGRGSARSVEGFSVLDAMKGGAEHMLRFGGHEQAAGCEIRADSIDNLRRAVCERARQMLAQGGLPESQVLIDYELPLPHMTPQLMRQIDQLEPFGEQNEKPILLSSDVRLARPAMAIGADRTHLMLHVRRGATELKALAFGMAHRIDELKMGSPLSIVYTPKWNTFRGETKLELFLVDFACGEETPQLTPLS